MRGSWHLGQRGQSIWEKWVDGTGRYSDIAQPQLRRERYRTFSRRKLPRARTAIIRYSHGWHGFSWSNSLVFENKGAYLGPTACVALPSQVPGAEPAQRRTQQGRRVGNRRPAIVGLAGRCAAERCDDNDRPCLPCRALRRARMPVAVCRTTINPTIKC